MHLVTLTTEWRPDDIYGGILKGMLLRLSPGITVIDNACNIPPFSISHAAFIVRNTFESYPKGTVHIICVHSEAGEDQDYLLVRARDHYFIGTDNGIFNLILNSEPEEVIRLESSGSTDELAIFANAAAAIAGGIDIHTLGMPADKIIEKIPLRATIDKEVIIGSIIFIDSYGNAISNITREVFYRVFENKKFRILIQSNKNHTGTISGRYCDVPVGDLLARFNQLDLLEVSINGADVSELLSLSIGSVIRVDVVYKTSSPERLF
jgi:S-adenosylmethionine hydrolase